MFHGKEETFIVSPSPIVYRCLNVTFREKMLKENIKKLRITHHARI